MDYEKYFAEQEKNWEKIKKRDQKAKNTNKLVGRYISEPVADGKAIYVIDRENKNTVRIKHCKGLGDDYMVPYWGEAHSLDKEYALKSISFRDYLDSLVEKRKSKAN
jgi:hypothetical protein